MRRRTSRAAGPCRALPAVLAAGSLALAGCGGGNEATGERWTPSDVEAPAVSHAVTAAAGRGSAEGTAPVDMPALQPEGEIELTGDRVERAYRVRIVNGPRALEDVVAELVGVASGVEVVQGRIELGSLAAGAVVAPAATVTLRHAASFAVDPASLRWRLHEHAMGTGSAGRLLGGPPEQLAGDAVRDFKAATPPSGRPMPKLAAVLSGRATVADANRALRAAGVRIAEMRPRSRALTLGFVAAPDEGARKRALALLAASNAFELVRVLPAAPMDAGAADAAPEPDSACDA